ncbi:relaxase/mobilization nuclease [Streptomyces sp. NPDC050161]|uniref:relaxase/mobilization nuclease n=1 Tax=Streptomyces sp. NPDC050161 TaxID=3365604 RepID=UPI0037A87F4E
MHGQAASSAEVLAGILGRPVSIHEFLNKATVRAYWTGRDQFLLDDEEVNWTSAQWAAHLHHLRSPVGSPPGDRPPLWHASVRLDPADRALTGPEWSEIAHRLTRAAGITRPGDDQGCRWIAVQGQPAQLDLLASLVREDGTWQSLRTDPIRHLADEVRRIEGDFHLHTHQPHLTQAPAPPHSAPHLPDATQQVAQLLVQLADEHGGPLATARGFVEHAAQRLAGLSQPYGPDAGHRLQWAARRLHGIQQDLDSTATALLEQGRPSTPPAPAPAPVPAPATRRFR